MEGRFTIAGSKYMKRLFFLSLSILVLSGCAEQSPAVQSIFVYQTKSSGLKIPSHIEQDLLRLRAMPSEQSKLISKQYLAEEHDWSFYYLMGGVLKESGLMNEAESSFLKSWQLLSAKKWEPDIRFDPRDQLAELYISEANRIPAGSKVKELYKKALALNPENSYVWWKYAHYLQSVNDPESDFALTQSIKYGDMSR